MSEIETVKPAGVTIGVIYAAADGSIVGARAIDIPNGNVAMMVQRVEKFKPDGAKRARIFVTHEVAQDVIL